MRANKILFSIIAVAVVVRLVLWCFQKDPALGDGWRYMKEGVNIVQHATFSDKLIDPSAVKVQPTAWDMPLYACLVAGTYGVTGSIPTTQKLLGLLNIALVVGSACFFLLTMAQPPFKYSVRQKAMSLVVLLFMPEMVIYSLFHMTEQLAIFFLCATMWAYLRGINGHSRHFVWATLFLIGGIYTKPIFLPLGCALIAAIPLVSNGKVVCRVLKSIILLLVVFAALSPWYLRNKSSIGTGGLATVVGFNPYGYNLRCFAEYAKKDSILAEMKAYDSQIASLDEIAQSQAQGKFAKEKLLANIGEYSLFAMKGCIGLFTSIPATAYYQYLGQESLLDASYAWAGAKERRRFEVDRTNYRVPSVVRSLKYDNRDVLVVQVIWGLVFSLTLVGYGVVFWGVVASVKSGLMRPSYAFVMSISCILLCAVLITAISGPAVGCSRYRTLIMPLLALLAGGGLTVGGKCAGKNCA